MVTLLGAVLAAAGGVILLALPNHAGLRGFLGSAGNCLIHLGHQQTPAAEEVVALLGAGAVTALAIRIGAEAVRQTRRDRRRREHSRFLVRLASPRQSAKTTVVWLDSADPVAFALAGRPGLIVMSTGLRAQLPASAMAATLAHERAHLRGRHHRALAIADVLAAALPRAPLLRAAPACLRTLVELSADAVAVQQCGAPALRRAFLSFDNRHHSIHGLGMAGPTVDGRLLRLDSPIPVRPAAVRNLASGVVGLAVIILPFASSVGALLLVTCPIG
ncbi:MAG: M56 family metallopeptidase [Pseudonocardiales bacterium]